MRVLVTGAGGLVGSALVRSGKVTGLTRAQLDITDPAAVAHALDEHRPSAIINAAAQAGVDRADAEPEWTYAVNAEAPAVMVELARDRGIRLVHLSTDYVLDSPERERLSDPAAVNLRANQAGRRSSGTHGRRHCGSAAVGLLAAR